MPTTLVTGVSRGIGRAIADYLAARGHTVLGLARSAPKPPFAGLFTPVDLADRVATRGVLARLTAEHRIDNLVNNAGLIHTAPLGEIREADLQETLDVNIAAAILCSQACLPAMIGKGRGRIVNLGSRAALGKVGRSSYSATKAGLMAMTRVWAIELARRGITVNCIAPGPIETEMFLANNPPGSPVADALTADIPVGRMGRPDEVAAPIHFLLSDEAAFITGQTIYVCGGLSIGMAPI